MDSELTPQNEHFLRQVLSDGVFADRSEMLNAAVELLRQHEALKEDLRTGADQVARGECGPLDFEALKARVRERVTQAQGIS